MEQIDTKKLLDDLMQDLKSRFQSNKHLFAEHRWVPGNASDYRKISLATSDYSSPLLDLDYIHYELLIYSKDRLSVELHPEGNRAYKQLIEYHFDRIKIDYPFEYAAWNIGAGKGAREFRKIRTQKQAQVDLTQSYDKILKQTYDLMVHMSQEYQYELIGFLESDDARLTYEGLQAEEAKRSKSETHYWWLVMADGTLGENAFVHGEPILCNLPVPRDTDTPILELQQDLRVGDRMIGYMPNEKFAKYQMTVASVANSRSKGLFEFKFVIDGFLEAPVLIQDIERERRLNNAGIIGLRGNIKQLSEAAYQEILIMASNPPPRVAHQTNNPPGSREIRERIARRKQEFEISYGWIVDSSDFYFRQANTELYVLRKEDTVAIYLRLKELWDSRGRKRPKDFVRTLDEKAPDLKELYLQINRFLAYVDFNAWNKSEFNQYDDKRTIAKTGTNQSQLIDQFLEYAVNDFSFTTSLKRKSLYKAIRYIEDPIRWLSLLSERHRERVSVFLFGEVLEDEVFHQSVIRFFGEIGFNVENPGNRSLLYTRILYDHFRREWDDREGEQEVDASSEVPIEEIRDGLYIHQVSAVTRQSNDVADSEKDHLGFDNDVKALASLVALKELKPPLAIALFGRWGTGKSFFMRHMQRRIHELATYQGFLEEKPQKETQHVHAEDEDKFCHGVAQIEFNAWSYLDANLWAGLVSSIFEKLNEYLTENTKSNVAKLKVQQRLTERLHVLQESKSKALNQKEGLERIKEGYEAEVVVLEESIQSMGHKRLREMFDVQNGLETIYDKLLVDPMVSKHLLNGLKQDELLAEYSKWEAFVTNVKQGRAWIRPALVSIGLLAVGLWFKEMDFDWVDETYKSFVLPAMVLIGKLGIDVKKPFDTVKNLGQYVDLFNKAYTEHADIQARIDETRANIEQAEREIQEAEEELSGIEPKIALAEHQLKFDVTSLAISDFINERSDASDYKEHLGIISTIRQDFETLSGLFKDLSSEKEDAALVDDREAIKAQFEEHKKLDRIVLYIDDLDRCSDEKVLEVLQAVHLLMAFPLFVVVVGVDKRCVNNALNFKNIVQYAKSTGASSDKDIKERFKIDLVQPNEYLEKIFQIPFQLAKPDKTGVHNLIDSLFDEDEVKATPDIVLEEETPAPEQLLPTFRSTMSFEAEEITKPEEEQDEDIIVTETKAVREEVEEEQAPYELAEETAEEAAEEFEEVALDEDDLDETQTLVPVPPPDLSITHSELDNLKAVSVLVGKSPRTIKRFVNLYRLIRAHGSLEYDQENTEQEHLGIMLLLALQIGVQKEHAHHVFEGIIANADKILDDVLSVSSFEKVYVILDQTGQNEVNHRLRRTLDLSCARLIRHIPFVQRFTFEDYRQPHMNQPPPD